MKKLFFALMIAAMLSGAAFADDDYVGMLTRLRTSPDEFFNLMRNTWATQGWAILGGDHTTSKARFYDSLSQMQMALSRGDIDEMILPDFVAEYLLKTNPNYTPCCISNSGQMTLCFGFMKNRQHLLARWNSAIISMRNDFTLSGLYQKYVKNFPPDETYDAIYGINKRQREKANRVKFESFAGAPVVKVAVTGDLPPVDFVDEAGYAAGYSTAVLAEIGRRLQINIEIIQVDTASRTAAIVSGKADVVFWYEVSKMTDKYLDVPEEVLISEPYLEWNTFMHLKFDED
ncbi:MAG: transporter substrate-binding domain-containing protein [Synergistaceae bacterium]|nr:transporter substrate-binding domain-containing protein [Synergistaceae bacterium]